LLRRGWQGVCKTIGAVKQPFGLRAHNVRPYADISVQKNASTERSPQMALTL
jgi:hypothetical protein